MTPGIARRELLHEKGTGSGLGDLNVILYNTSCIHSMFRFESSPLVSSKSLIIRSTVMDLPYDSVQQ
jgi:hypothetical protein